MEGFPREVFHLWRMKTAWDITRNFLLERKACFKAERIVIHRGRLKHWRQSLISSTACIRQYPRKSYYCIGIVSQFWVFILRICPFPLFQWKKREIRKLKKKIRKIKLIKRVNIRWMEKFLGLWMYHSCAHLFLCKWNWIIRSIQSLFFLF